jgi:hypothetical protein
LWLKSVKFAYLFFCLFVFGCQSPPVPPEAEKAELQEQNLWRAGAPDYAGEDYLRYKVAIQQAKDRLGKEKLKLGFFRNYGPVKADFDLILERGELILQRIRQKKEVKSDSIVAQVDVLKKKLKILEDISLSINERGLARRSLTQAQVMLNEVEQLCQKEKFEGVPGKLSSMDGLVRQAGGALLSMLKRYEDPGQISRWRRWAEETISESRKKGVLAIVVNKLDHKLILYRKGVVMGTYSVGLGLNGLSDKLYAGDDATPEGKYHVIQKFPTTSFYKAFLINYPNDEDRRQFNQAKERGELVASAAIGGQIEIHGGGKDSLTKGCVSMENEDIDRIFNLVAIGTPVTIVGALDIENGIITTLRNL